MKKPYIAILGSVLPLSLFAQSAIDAQQVTQSDFKGTARFMSMGGAFTALGGDLSTMNQNPAGIGVYRSSEIGVTLDINAQKTETPYTSSDFLNSASQTKLLCNNFGYVGATLLSGPLKTINWGVSFNRAVSFDRVYNGYLPTIPTSLSNYIASYSYGIPADEITSSDRDKYNPYLNTNYDWLSILAYNSFMINETGSTPEGGNSYSGLYKGNSTGDALFNVRERGSVDEYNISVGGNVENVVYWGLSVGITDLEYQRSAYYSESIDDALVPDDNGYLGNGNYEYHLDNLKTINGTGWNLKAGLIFRPINELRIGVAVHTPTWYKLNQSYVAVNDFTYTPTDNNGNSIGKTNEGSAYTDPAYFEWKLNAPWKFMIGLAGVIGNKAIVSADYEFQGYGSMSAKTPYRYDDWGNGYQYRENSFINNGVKDYFKNMNIMRLGIEYRLTPQLSARAGYNVSTSNIKDPVYDGMTEVITSGTDPSYTFTKKTQNISCGLGFRYQAWYIDAAYVYTDRDSRYNAFTGWNDIIAPSMSVKDHNSSIVLSTGFKF